MVSNMSAYRGTILRVGLSAKKLKTEEIPGTLLERYLGGRGLCAKIYYDEVPSDVDPLSPDNKIIFTTGPFTATIVFGGSKCSLATKSPCTGIYLCSNASGFFGAELKFAGYDGLIIEGRAEKPTYLQIMDTHVEFKDATHLWGKNVGETTETIKEQVGDKKVRVICIGPAGERLVKLACIMAEGRSFGRGGAGAVMGSKNLKAVVVRGTNSVEVAEPDKLREYLRECIRPLRETTDHHTLYGTALYIEPLYECEAIPVMNYQRTTHDDAENLFADVLREKYRIRSVACFSCPVACGHMCEVKNGVYKGVNAKPEYEMIWSLGFNCGVFNYNAIISGSYLCNELGVDGISTGNVIGFAMELYEKGILSKSDVDGIEAKFGEEENVLELIRKIGLRDGVGDLLASGVRQVSKVIEKGSEHFAMHVKGLEMTGYEPRSFYGMGLAYATSSRGACHNVGGWTIRAELLKKALDRFAVEGKGELVKSLQDVRAYIDSIGICTIPRRALRLTEKPDERIINYATGLDFSGKLLLIGERVYNLERLILNREGISRKDDDLPPRMKVDPLPDGIAKGRCITQEMLDQMLNEYYAARGWSLEGRPTMKKLKQLGLSPT